MPLVHLRHHPEEPQQRHIRPHRLAEYTAVGGALGAASHALGATVLSPADPAGFPIGGAALCGLVGGAAIHGACGFVAALAPRQALRDDLRALAASTLVSSTIGGLVGAGLLAGTSVDAPAPGHMVLAGITGGYIFALGAGCYSACHWLCCCIWPSWLAVDAASDHDSIFGSEREERRALARGHSGSDSATSLA